MGWEAFKGLKKFSSGGWGWVVEKVIIVSVHVLYEGFTPVLRQTGWVIKYLSLRRFRSVYIGGKGHGARQYLSHFFIIFKNQVSFGICSL